MQVVCIIGLPDPFHELVAGELAHALNDHCGHLLGAGDLPDLGPVAPLLGEERGEEQLVDELPLADGVVVVEVEHVLLLEAAALVQDVVVDVLVRERLHREGDLRLHEVVQVLIVLQMVEVAL